MPKTKGTGITKGGIFFRRYGTAIEKAYPAWRYHKINEPICVENTDEDLKVQKEGYKPLANIASKSPHLMNFMADFEDMSPKQIVLYVKEEFDIDLPVEAKQTKLLQVIWRLMLNSPKNKDRIVLLAQSIRMNYDETVKEIKRVVQSEEAEVETEEIYA
jgi:hypothetical protein